MRTVEPPAPAPALALREQQFVGMGGKLIGKPDVVLPQEIRDYKSGSLYEEDADGIEVAKASYLRQLRLYGHLVRENRGYCPPMGRLMAMDGKTVEVELDEHACLAEAKEAIGILDSFNSKLGTAHSVAEVASPSPTSCRWCPFKTICPAFWKNVNPSWIELGSAAIQGTLNADPTAIHNGRAVAIALDAVAGTQTGSVSIAPLDQTIFPHISKFRKGEQVRIVNLRAREDGQVFPTPVTVCLRETDCPEFALPSVH